MLRCCDCFDYESNQIAIHDDDWHEQNRNLIKHDGELPVLIMQGAAINESINMTSSTSWDETGVNVMLQSDNSAVASPDEGEKDGPKVMSLKEFTAYYGRVGDFGSTMPLRLDEAQ